MFGCSRRRALSIRIRRMASAAAAKKWRRLAKPPALAGPTSRKYASWTRAVALSVCPGSLAGELFGGGAAQFVIDQRHELLLAACGSPVWMASRMRVTSVMMVMAPFSLPVGASRDSVPHCAVISREIWPGLKGKCKQAGAAAARRETQQMARVVVRAHSLLCCANQRRKCIARGCRKIESGGVDAMQQSKSEVLRFLPQFGAGRRLDSKNISGNREHQPCRHPVGLQSRQHANGLPVLLQLRTVMFHVCRERRSSPVATASVL